MSNPHHAIKAVARRTGLSAHVIRVWEKRYQAVEPERTETNRRLYSEAQIERLVLLRDLVHAGHSIGNVARLPTAQLQELAAQSATAALPVTGNGKDANVPASFLQQCLAAVKALDARALENALNRAATELGAQGLLQRVIAPLAQTIGDQWRDGTITAAHEHFASVIIRIFLGHAARSFTGNDNGPVLAVATPAGQLHELGALLAAATAANLGWQVMYLGASLPAAEIAGAVKQSQARVLALSLVYPEDDPRLEGELTRLRDLLPPEVKLLAGGRAVAAYSAALEKINAVPITDLAHLGEVLDSVRKPARRTKR